MVHCVGMMWTIYQLTSKTRLYLYFQRVEGDSPNTRAAWSVSISVPLLPKQTVQCHIWNVPITQIQKWRPFSKFLLHQCVCKWLDKKISDCETTQPGKQILNWEPHLWMARTQTECMCKMLQWQQIFSPKLTHFPNECKQALSITVSHFLSVTGAFPVTQKVWRWEMSLLCCC